MTENDGNSERGRNKHLKRKNMLTDGKRKMNDKQLKQYIGDIGRTEVYQNPDEYYKATRNSLIALGFDTSWVNDKFQTAFMRKYKKNNYDILP